MSETHSIFSLLPRLRRYARALTGDRAAGDKLVILALQRLSLSRQGDPPLIEALSALNKLAGLSSQLADRGALPAGMPADRLLLRISLEERQAFLMNALEGLSFDEIGQVLDITASNAGDLVSKARAQFKKGLETSILIIEDDRFIAADLSSLASSIGHTVCGVARNFAEAMEAAQEFSPGLIYCDINLDRGESGITTLNQIQKIRETPSIFITSTPERLLTGAEGEPAYLIRKPYKRSEVEAMTSHAILFFDGAVAYQDAAAG